MSDARDALREQFNKWCDSQTGFLFSPGAKSSDFFYEIWLAGRDARAQAERDAVAEVRAVPFNLNDYVRVKLNDDGRALLRADYEAMMPPRYKYVPPTEDADGWSRWQLWSLMQALGPHIRMGSLPPLETTIEIEHSANAAPRASEANIAELERKHGKRIAPSASEGKPAAQTELPSAIDKVRLDRAWRQWPPHAPAAATDDALIEELNAAIQVEALQPPPLGLLLRCRERLAQDAVRDDGHAGWLAQMVIDKLGGTNDLPAWVNRSAQYWRDTQNLLERKDKALRKYAMHGDDCRCWAGTVAAPIPCTCGLDAALGDTQEGM